MGLPTTIIFRNHLGFSHRVIKRTTVRLRQCATTLYMPWLHKKMPFYIYSKTCHLLHSTVRTLEYNAYYIQVNNHGLGYFFQILVAFPECMKFIRVNGFKSVRSWSQIEM